MLNKHTTKPSLNSRLRSVNLAGTMRAVAIAGVTALMVGCASTGAVESSAAAQSATAQAGTSATHYWQSKRQAGTSDYQRDNSRCGQMNDVSTQSPMAYDSESFEAYRQCMIERGYVLRTY